MDHTRHFIPCLILSAHFQFLRLTAVGTHYTPAIPNNLAELPDYSGARLISKHEFSAAFFNI